MGSAYKFLRDLSFHLSCINALRMGLLGHLINVCFIFFIFIFLYVLFFKNLFQSDCTILHPFQTDQLLHILSSTGVVSIFYGRHF